MFGREKMERFAAAQFAEGREPFGPEGRHEGHCGHHGREERHHGRHGGPGGMFEGFMGRHGRGFGVDRERLFDGGELRLVILQLLAE